MSTYFSDCDVSTDSLCQSCLFLNYFKSSVGLRYENLLEEKLAELKIPYLGKEHSNQVYLWGQRKHSVLEYIIFCLLGENDMRSQGYDKTPDFKLQVPIGNNEIQTGTMIMQISRVLSPSSPNFFLS